MSTEILFFYRKRPDRSLRHLSFTRLRPVLKTFGKRSANVTKTKQKRSENDKWAPGLSSPRGRGGGDRGDLRHPSLARWTAGTNNEGSLMRVHPGLGFSAAGVLMVRWSLRWGDCGWAT